MIDHISLRTPLLEAMQRFYDCALAPLGWSRVVDFPGGAGYGPNGGPILWLSQTANQFSSVHLALSSSDRATVYAFHAAALAAGGKDNGAPGIRAAYHPNYYAAFVIDPDGNNLEVVCHHG